MAEWLSTLDQEETNTVRPTSRARQIDFQNAETEEQAKTTETEKSGNNKGKPDLPEYITKTFIRVETKFYFQNREPAFSFKNDELRAKASTPEVVRGIVEIAKHKEWKSITVNGSKDFRRAVWLEAYTQGLEVTGYQPTEVEKAQADKLKHDRELSAPKQENTVMKGDEREIVHNGVSVTYNGVKVVHNANVPNGQDMRGVLLEKPGQAKAKAKKAPDKQTLGQQFLYENKEDVLSNHPELARAYAGIAVAEKFARSVMKDEKQVQRFVSKAAMRYAETIDKGEKIPGPTMKASTLQRLLAEQKQEQSRIQGGASGQAKPETQKTQIAPPERQRIEEKSPIKEPARAKKRELGPER